MRKKVPVVRKPRQIVKQPIKRSTLKAMRQFSFAADVLSIDDTIDWIEQRIELGDMPPVPKNCLPFLYEMRRQANLATGGKRVGYG